MATTTLTERAPAQPPPPGGVITGTLGHPEGISRGPLGHPIAYLVTAAILLTIFGWTFFTNPDRVAPTKDPAYYTWRTEALLTESPKTLLSIEGPEVEGGGGMFSSGYRVTAPILGGLLRRVPGVATLSTTTFLMVGVPVLTALLLASFAYQQRRDPLIFHAVALGVASLYLTPPFVGYLDNILALFFIAAGLPFLAPSKNSWPARVGLGLFLLLCGLTHPTTLVIFCAVLGIMAFVRWVARRFDLRSVIRDDGPMLVTAFVSVVVTYAIWKIGIWGPSASLGDAALPPPYESSFFVDRMVLWAKAMRPALNGPLFLIGLVGLLVGGRRAAEDDLARVSIVWLAPLAGLFGFVAGLTYPYYRFFNTTLAWVLLVGIGMYFAALFFLRVASRGGVSRLAYLGLVALLAVVVTNFTAGLDESGWNNASGGWLSAKERSDLDGLRDVLGSEPQQRPVVFVIDSDDHSPRVYGYTKLSGNTSRYGLPAGWIDEGHVYVGSLENFLAGEPTRVGEKTYDAVSEATLEETSAAVEGSDEEPIVVVAAAFNETGSNVEVAKKDADLSSVSTEDEIWVLDDGMTMWKDGRAKKVDFGFTFLSSDGSSAVHIVRVIGGLLLLLLPGVLAFRWFRPDGEFAEAVGVAPALAIGLVTLVGIAVLAIAGSPLSSTIGWSTVGVAVAIAAGLFVSARTRRAVF